MVFLLHRCGSFRARAYFRRRGVRRGARPPCRSWPCIRPIRLTGNWQAPFSMPPARPRYCGTLPLSSTSEASSSYGCWSRRQDMLGMGLGATGLALKTVTTQFIMVNLLFWMASRLIPLNFFRNLMLQGGSSSARSSESHGSANRRRGSILRMTPIKSYASSSPASSTPSCPSGSCHLPVAVRVLMAGFPGNAHPPPTDQEKSLIRPQNT